MGKYGPEVCAIYPDIFDDEQKRIISLKSIPVAAKDGDVGIIYLGDLMVLSHVYVRPMKDSRPMLYTLCFAADKGHNPEEFQGLMKSIVEGIKSSQMFDDAHLQEIAKNVYSSLMAKKSKIKFTTSFIIEIEQETVNSSVAGKDEELKDELEELRDVLWD